MKLSKRTLLLMAAGAFVLIAAYLYMGYSERVDEQDQLNGQLAQAQLSLSGIQIEALSARQTELESQLSQATAQLDAVKAILSQPVGSIAATTILFEVAAANGLEVTEMTSSAPTTESLEGVTWSVISLTAKVEGDVPSLVSFVTSLNSYLTTGIVKSTIITVPETNPETNNEAKPSVDIQLVVYTYQGD